ncbi:LPS export ABC transporter periplasmic protein LptC [Prosthecochloris aestuarii]|uniref:LPS export ABC transporter periplasmic protein LptC n=1 Tax=Prosthecochloris aestuarii TaxID=1102 RepID=UPI001427C12C|nr:LPS export ABC transporter periplasmic protein LptC [Prosthecochloris aestuarii]
MLLLTALVSCGSPSKESRTADLQFVGENAPVQESWDITITLDSRGRSRIELKAAHLSEYRDDKSITRELDGGVEAVFSDSSGVTTATIHAEKGTIHPNGDLEAFNDVILTSADRTVIKTSYIKRFASTSRLWTDRYIVIEKPSETIRGYGLESDDALKNYTIFKASGEAELKP